MYLLFNVRIAITQFSVQAQHQEEIDREDYTDDNFYCHNIQIYGFSFERKYGVKVSFITRKAVIVRGLEKAKIL